MIQTNRRSSRSETSTNCSPSLEVSAGLALPPGDPWKQAAQMAAAIAAEGAGGNLDPLDRMAVEDLSRVADLHVRQLPGVNLGLADIRVEAVSKQAWTEAAVEAYRPFFERFGEALGQAGDDEITDRRRSRRTP